MRDVIVVGAGPAGSSTARQLAEQGRDVLLVEEHDRVGDPVQCAGLFTPKIFDLAPVDLDPIHRNTVYGAHIYAPDDTCVSIRADEPRSHAIDRGEFDYRMSRLAKDAGAELRESTKAMDVQRSQDGVEVELVPTDADDGAYTEEAKLLVGADGVQSRVAKWFDLPSAREVIPCYGAEMTGIQADDPEYVEMFVGEDRAPGFFSWIIPTNEEGTTGKVEAGIGRGAPKPTKYYWERMWEDKTSARFLQGAESVDDICGCIPVGPPRRSTDDRVMLVGDAATQAKPTTGGGVYMSLEASRHLAETVDEAFREGDFTNQLLSRYHDRWKGDIGRELEIAWRMRKAFLRLDDDQISELFTIMDDPEVIEVINQLGDIDYPSKVAKGLLKTAPQLFKFTPTFVRSLFD